MSRLIYEYRVVFINVNQISIHLTQKGYGLSLKPLFCQVFRFPASVITNHQLCQQYPFHASIHQRFFKKVLRYQPKSVMVRPLTMTQPSTNIIRVTGSVSEVVSVRNVLSIINNTQHHKEMFIFSIIKTKNIRVYHIQYGIVLKERNVTPEEDNDLRPLFNAVTP